MKKPWNPRRPRHPPPSNTPSSFLLLFPPSVLSSSPTSPYISWDTLISRIQQLHATRFTIQKARSTFFLSLFMSDCNISRRILKRAVYLCKNKKKITNWICLFHHGFAFQVLFFNQLKSHYWKSKKNGKFIIITNLYFLANLRAINCIQSWSKIRHNKKDISLYLDRFRFKFAKKNHKCENKISHRFSSTTVYLFTINKRVRNMYIRVSSEMYRVVRRRLNNKFVPVCVYRTRWFIVHVEADWWMKMCRRDMSI